MSGRVDVPDPVPEPPADLAGLRLVGRRRKAQAPPVHVMVAALADPTTRNRPWLDLADGEVAPVVRGVGHDRVVWASLWPEHAEDRVELLVAAHEGTGCLVEWRLWSPVAREGPSVRARCRRLQEIINRDLRNDHFDG